MSSANSAMHSVARSHLIPPSPGKSLPVRGFRSRSHTSYQAVTRNHTPHGPKHGPNTGAKNSLPIGVRHRQGAVLPKQPHRVMRLGRRCSNSEDVRPNPVSQVHRRSSGRTTVARESVDLLEPLRNKAAGGDIDFLHEAVAVLGGSRQGPGEASTSAAPRPRRRDHGTTSYRVSSRTSRQRTPRIRTRNDWASMQSCGPTRWHALESSRVEHADDCVLASLDGRAGGRWESLDTQERACLEYAEAAGYTVI